MRCSRGYSRFNLKLLIIFIPLCLATYGIYRHDDSNRDKSKRHMSIQKHNNTSLMLPAVLQHHVHLENSEHSNSNMLSNFMRLTNTLHGELSMGPVDNRTKLELENLISSGHGLKPYTTERGEAGWIENGIIYRPWRKPELTAIDKIYPNPYTTEYEAYVPFNEELFFEGREPNPSYKMDPKIILWYTPTRYTQPAQDLKKMELCPEFPCRITTNRQFAEISSAMIFAGQILDRAPPKRRSDQMFVLQNHEPPYTNRYFLPFWEKGFKQSAWKKAFNWTMTYRMDSDFVAPYGIVRKRPIPVEKDYKKIVANKKKLAVWLVSNCNTSSTRETYIKELKKYIDIDVYGKCGTFKCPRDSDGKCSEIISNTYKFYLSFESAICPDYITEKFFHYLTMDTILVARGSDQYYQHAPRKIFLNTASFPSPRELAMRMLFLHNNDDAYIGMLKEKDKYMALMEGPTVRNPDGFIRNVAYCFQSVPLCQVCQRLWNLDKYAKSVPDIHQWLDEKLCRKPDDLKF